MAKNRIRELRKSLNMSQETLAEKNRNYTTSGK